MNNKSLIKVNSLLSASEEVVTSLMTGLIEMVLDKMAVDKVVLDKMAVDKVAVDKAAIKSGSEKKVVRKANIVQRKSLELKFREKDEIVSREKLEKVKSSSRSKSFTPMWVEEPKLPSGWKSCVAAPGKAALYYSPCGKLFTNWAQVEKFLGPVVMKEVAGAEEMLPQGKTMKQETLKTEKSPEEVRKTDLSGKERSGQKDIKNKNALGSLKKTPRSAEKVAFKPKDRMFKSYSKLSGDLELSDDVISLSDEE